jgi:hypothetical protein
LVRNDFEVVVGTAPTSQNEVRPGRGMGIPEAANLGKYRRRRASGKKPIRFVSSLHRMWPDIVRCSLITERLVPIHGSCRHGPKQAGLYDRRDELSDNFRFDVTELLQYVLNAKGITGQKPGSQSTLNFVECERCTLYRVG